MPIGLVIAAGISGGAAITGGVLAHKSAENAATATAAASDKQLAYLTGKDAQDQANFASTAAENQREFNTTQQLNVDQYNQKESRLAPYRSIGAGATGTLADLIGAPMLPVPSGAASPSASSPSSGSPSMSSALTGSSPAPGAGTAAPTDASGNPTDPNAINAQLLKNYQSLGLTPTGPGTGPTDIAYYGKQIAATGGLTPNNVSYWFGPTGRIASDAAKAKSGAAGASPTAATADINKPFSVMAPSAAPTMASFYARTAPLAALGA